MCAGLGCEHCLTPRFDPQVRNLAAVKGKAAVESSGAKAAQLLPVLIGFLDVDAQRVLPASRCASMPSLVAAAANGSTSRAAPSGATSVQVRLMTCTFCLCFRSHDPTPQDRIKAGVIGLLAVLAGQLSADNLQALVSRLTAWLSAPSDLVQQALGAALPSVLAAAAVSEAQRREIVSALLERVRSRMQRLLCVLGL